MAESFVHPETAIASLSSLLDVARCLFVRPQDVRVAFVARTPWLEKGDIVHGNLDADQLRQVIQHLYPEVLSDAEKLRAERDQLRADVERCAQVGWYGLVEAERKNASRHYGAALALAENRDRAVRRAEAAEARVAELERERDEAGAALAKMADWRADAKQRAGNGAPVPQHGGPASPGLFGDSEEVRDDS